MSTISNQHHTKYRYRNRRTLSMTGLTLATSNAETIVLKSSLLQANTPLTLAAEYRIVWARSDISPLSFEQ
jgi:hypothetical protein